MARNIQFGFIFLLFFFSSSTYACNEYLTYSSDELKTFRAILKNEQADDFEKLEAFDRLICSDNPNIRNYAVQEGLKSSSSSLVRNQILLNTLMEKSKISIHMSEHKKSTDKDKAFITKFAGIYHKDISYKSKERGCLGFYYKECRTAYSLKITGDMVEFSYQPVLGEFRLSQSGELVGFIRGAADGSHTKIPASIKLF